MTDTPDIEALVAKLRDDDLVCSWQATTKAMLEKAAATTGICSGKR